jgi:hypothetical protein
MKEIKMNGVSNLHVCENISSDRLFNEMQRKLTRKVENKILCKIWGFHGGDYDDYHLPEDDNHQ